MQDPASFPPDFSSDKRLGGCENTGDLHFLHLGALGKEPDGLERSREMLKIGVPQLVLTWGSMYGIMSAMEQVTGSYALDVEHALLMGQKENLLRPQLFYVFVNLSFDQEYQ